MANGTATLLTFSHVDSKTKAPVHMGEIFFSLLDLDSTRHGFETVKINETMWSRFWAFTNESRAICARSAPKPCSAEVNPTVSTGLPMDSMAESVTLFMNKARQTPRSLFEARLRHGGMNWGVDDVREEALICNCVTARRRGTWRCSYLLGWLIAQCNRAPPYTAPHFALG